MRRRDWKLRLVTCLFALAAIPAGAILQNGFAQASHQDSLLVEQIRDEFAKDSRMPVSGISISVIRGVVRLKGVVRTLAQKSWASEIAYKVPGVRAVDNQIWVDRSRIPDDRLREMVAARLKENSEERYRNVRIAVKNGRVRLTGTVSSWGVKYAATDILSTVPGVQRIDNNLKIRDERNRTDEQIRRAVQRALREKIQMSQEYFIRVRVVRGIVTLQGRVKTDTLKRTAIQTALFVPGVVDLVDKIEVLPE